LVTATELARRGFALPGFRKHDKQAGMAARARAAAATGGNDLSRALAWLEKNGSQKVRDGMARYGIPSERAFGISVGTLKAYAHELGKNQTLALGLWSTGFYEARMLAAFVAEPAALDVRQMNAWAKDFDSWAICDTVCFHVFDRTPLAWGRLTPWAAAKAEFHKRGAFALLWGLTVHDKQATDDRFLECLPLIEAAATDERDYVKKGVDMALRALGKRNAPLRTAALELAARLSEADTGPSAWIGRSALRDLAKARTARSPTREAPSAKKTAAKKPSAKKHG
jgi:3-methyladenine DNA glycosylase AlkD